MEELPRGPSLAGAGDEYAQWDAAYVLGSLTKADRQEFEAHMQGCPSCRQSVGELGGMPALLGLLSVDEASAIDEPDPDMPPSRVLTSLLATVSRQRRNARLVRWGTVAAAAAAIVVAVVIGVQLRPAAPSSPTRAAAPMTRVADTELTATVALTSRGWGTQIDMNCNYPAEPNGSAQDKNEQPDRLAMEVIGSDGKHDRVATWMAVQGVEANLVGNTSMPMDQISTVQIVSADTGNVLLQRSV